MHRLAVLLLAFASVSLRAATANQQAKVVKDAQAIAEAQASLLAMGASALTIQDSVSSGTLTTDLGKGPATVIEKRKIICVVPGSKKSRFEQYREAWLDEATPFRLQSALYRWDAEWDYWTAMQKLLISQVFQGCKEGEPFPALEAIRPKGK